MARSHGENSGRVRSPDSGPRRDPLAWRYPFPDAEAILPPKRDPGKSRMVEAEMHAFPAGRSVGKFLRSRHLRILMLSNPPLQHAGGGVATDVRSGVDVQKPPRNRRIQVILTSSVAGRPVLPTLALAPAPHQTCPEDPCGPSPNRGSAKRGFETTRCACRPLGLPYAQHHGGQSPRHSPLIFVFPPSRKGDETLSPPVRWIQQLAMPRPKEHTNCCEDGKETAFPPAIPRAGVVSTAQVTFLMQVTGQCHDEQQTDGGRGT
jgi:hypothetical protein